MGPKPTRGDGRPWEEMGDSVTRVSVCESGLLGPNLFDIGGLVCVLVWILGCDCVVRGLEGTGEVDRDVEPDGGR